MNNTADTAANDYSWEDIPLSMAFSVHDHGRKSTGIVKQQMQYIMGKKQKQAAEKRYKNGEFWTEPQKSSKGDLRRCWQDFFQMRVFNWFPHS